MCMMCMVWVCMMICRAYVVYVCVVCMWCMCMCVRRQGCHICSHMSLVFSNKQCLTGRTLCTLPDVEKLPACGVWNANKSLTRDYTATYQVGYIIWMDLYKWVDDGPDLRAWQGRYLCHNKWQFLSLKERALHMYSVHYCTDCTATCRHAGPHFLEYMIPWDAGWDCWQKNYSTMYVVLAEKNSVHVQCICTMYMKNTMNPNPALDASPFQLCLRGWLAGISSSSVLWFIYNVCLVTHTESVIE